MNASRSIVLIGGGEHARVIADALLACGDLDRLAGFTDVATNQDLVDRFGAPWLGTDDDLTISAGGQPVLYGVLGFGGVRAAASRRAAVARMDRSLAGWATILHPAAVVARDTVIGDGTVILARTIVNTGSRVDSHCVINSGAVVEHDVHLGEHTQVAPGAVIGGGCRVGAGVYIGLGAVVRDHVQIGDDAVIAMGAVVVKDVGRGSRVRGVPAK